MHPTGTRLAVVNTPIPATPDCMHTYKELLLSQGNVTFNKNGTRKANKLQVFRHMKDCKISSFAIEFYTTITMTLCI